MSDRWAWTYTADVSDITPPAGIGRMMRRFYHTPSSLSVLVDPEGAPIDVYFFSPANQPNSKVWEPLFPNEAGGDDTHAFLNITTGLTNGTVGLRAERINGFGVLKQLLSAKPPIAATAGLKEFTYQHSDQASPSVADRYRLRFRFINNTLSPETVIFGIGNSSADLIRTTILMADPEIVWNSNALAFPGGLTSYDARPRADRVIDFSGGGVSATSLRHIFWQIRMGLHRFEDKEFQAALVAWWSWASRGKQYAFALDSAEKIDTTLDGSAAAGQAVIPLTSTTGISVGKKYLLRELIGEEFEIIQVASISAGVGVTASANLKYGYLSGDLFRSRDYFPKLVSLDDQFPVGEETTVFSLDHQAREDFG